MLLINGSTANSVTLGNGTNTVIAGTAGVTITAGSGANYVEVFGGNATITAGNNTGNDIKSDSGNATITIGGGIAYGGGGSDTFNLGSGGGEATGGWGSNMHFVGAEQWAIGQTTGANTIEMVSASGFAYVNEFNTLSDLLEVSNSAFGLGLSLTGSQTAAIGSLLSTTTDGTFSSSTACSRMTRQTDW